jgi:tetratricopeptide (TPR) repeat protein
VGLVHAEVGDFDKAVIAMEQAMRMEENVAFRHISYAQMLERLGDKKSMIEELERAVELEPTPQVLRILAEAYDTEDKQTLAASLRSQAQALDRKRGVAKTIHQANKARI